MNGINYNFTKKEVEAVARILKYARQSEETREDAKIVATAFNREAFNNMKYEFTKEEINILWEMVDLSLKAGGINNLAKVQTIIKALQRIKK